MARSSVGGRLPQIGAATLLAFALLVQGGGAGAIAVAASKAAPSAMTSTNLPAREIGRQPLNVRSLIGQPSPKQPFDPDVAAAALSQLKVPGASSGASGGSANPAAVAPPPDLATDSGQPAASVPVSQAGMS
ncbi:MAG TPA: hypothetical protein VKR24_11425, partial [Candidatus Limnocylindrales bacterium]|nr:hypothetical protein [Candidatus Limnocylindrales bacterium]